MRLHDQAAQATVTPAMALRYLRDGNDRFVRNSRSERNLMREVDETSDGQFPFAAIVTCIDSRTSPALIFDQGLGDIFSIRLAGAVVTEEVLGSLEFACKLAGAKLVVVLGHTKCGAIKGACDGVRLGNLSALLSLIQPAVDLERTVTDRRDSGNDDFVTKVTRIQIERSVERVLEGSAVLREMVERKEIGLVGALYDIETGQVAFLEETLT